MQPAHPKDGVRFVVIFILLGAWNASAGALRVPPGLSQERVCINVCSQANCEIVCASAVPGEAARGEVVQRAGWGVWCEQASRCEQDWAAHLSCPHASHARSSQPAQTCGPAVRGGCVRNVSAGPAACNTHHTAAPPGRWPGWLLAKPGAPGPREPPLLHGWPAAACLGKNTSTHAAPELTLFFCVPGPTIFLQSLSRALRSRGRAAFGQ